MNFSIRPLIRRAIGIAFLGFLATANADQPGAFKTLSSFDNTHGSGPAAPLLEGSDGHLYGTTLVGGAAGAGTVFRMNPSGKVTVLHSFVQDGHDGVQPLAALMYDRDGNLYGTTPLGGDFFSGTIFKISRRGDYSVVHSFAGGALDGSQSSAPLVQTEDGNFFGTTIFGGAYNQGVVFKMTPAGVVTVLHSFSGADGTFPQWGITLSRDGAFYGTTVRGGDFDCGLAYRISRSGEFTAIYSFSPGISGAAPSALIQASDGAFYGTTPQGGPSTGGTAFRLSAAGEITVLHGFSQGAPEGDSPNGLVQASDGNFYGTNANFGSDLLGTVFRMTPSGTVTVVHRFSPGGSRSPDDGALPLATPIQTRNGAMFGTTSQGGVPGVTPGDGTVYRFSPGRSID